MREGCEHWRAHGTIHGAVNASTVSESDLFSPSMFVSEAISVFILNDGQVQIDLIAWFFIRIVSEIQLGAVAQEDAGSWVLTRGL